MANIKKLDFFQLNVQKNSDSAKARACRNSDFWDGAGIYCPSLHADDPEAMFRGEITLPLPVDRFFADSQSPLITLPHFYLPVMAARGETWSVQDTTPVEISGDLPSGFGRSSHTGHSLGPQRRQGRGWWCLSPELRPLRTSGTHYSYADLLPTGNHVGP